MITVKHIVRLLAIATCVSLSVHLAQAGAQPEPGTATNRPATNSEPVYVAVITNGQVYIHLITHPDPNSRIGPFVKKHDNHYICETKDKGTRYLDRESDGRWFYQWTYVQMCGARVDAHVLEKKKDSQPPSSGDGATRAAPEK